MALIATVAAVLAIAPATAALADTPTSRVVSGAGIVRSAPDFAAFRSHFSFGSRRRYGYGYSYGRRPSLLHRVVKTAIWLYVLHLFFTHGGLSILLWIIIIIGLVFALARRRRRRYPYRTQSF